jgi:diguanylate cyclase (GGDEF)-like protein
MSRPAWQRVARAASPYQDRRCLVDMPRQPGNRMASTPRTDPWRPHGHVALNPVLPDIQPLPAPGCQGQDRAHCRRMLSLATDWTWAHDAQLCFRWTAQRNGPGNDGAHQAAAGVPHDVEPLAGWEHYRSIVAARQPFRDLDLAARGADGLPLFVSISGEPLFGADGAWLGYGGIGRDVTLQRRDAQLQRMEHEVTRCLADAASAEDGLAAALRTVCRGEGWACGEYWFVDETVQALRFGGYWDAVDPQIRQLFERARGFVFPPGVGLAGRVWESGEPIWVEDVNTDPRMLRRDLARQAGLHGAFLFPTFSAGTVIGVFAFWSQAIRKPDPRLMQAITVVGSQVGQFLKRKQAEQVLRHSEARFRALTELSSDWYWEQDADGRFTCVEGRGAARIKQFLGRRSDELGYSAEGGWETHRAAKANRQPFRDLMLSHGTGDDVRFVCVSGEPVFAADGSFKGYRGVSRDVTQRRRAEERIRYLALHDGLTGLPNRTMFGQILAREIESARRYGRCFAVLFIDVDRFKTINDSLGHAAGDELLCEIAARLVGALRASDVVARLGGDEFVVLLQETQTEDEVSAVARKILCAVMRPIMAGGHECRVTSSIGVSMFPADAQDEAALMKNADLAMYMAKEAGKNNHQRYSKESRTRALERMSIEMHLRRALERGELSLHYQAQLDLATHRICGVEALLRWNSPELGAVSPATFIPVAEETGMIVPIGLWVLRAACRQSTAWQRQGLPPVRMAVNLSPRQFAEPGLTADIAAVLQETGLAPQLLELEITEGMVMRDTERTVQLLQDIKSLGVGLAIDDFGTGYSSLAQLRRFPIDTLKVDRSFIREITRNAEDKAITEAIITMGRTLSLTVVAEGVETPEQLALLRDKACDQIQGYHFSRPIPPEQFAELVRSHWPPATATTEGESTTA